MRTLISYWETAGIIAIQVKDNKTGDHQRIEVPVQYFTQFIAELKEFHSVELEGL